MPHYKDETPARVGDLVKFKTYELGPARVGQVVGIQEGTDTCNLAVAHLAYSLPAHVEDGKVVPTPGVLVNVSAELSTCVTAGGCEKVA